MAYFVGIGVPRSDTFLANMSPMNWYRIEAERMSEKSPSLLFRPWNSTKELGFQPPDLPLGSTISYFSDILLEEAPGFIGFNG